MKKEGTTLFILDEEEDYLLDVEKKEVKGPKKIYTKDEFKEKSKDIPIFVVPPEGHAKKAIYGFTNESKLEKWLEKEKLTDKYNKYKKIRKKTKKDLTSDEELKIKEHQTTLVTDANEKLKKEMERNNIKPDELERIKELLDDYDPLYGPAAQCLIIYEHPWFQGRWLYLLPGLVYPNLGWFGFNDIISSIINIGHFAIFYEHPWFQGRQFHCWATFNDFVWAWWLFFNDTFSSVIVIF